MVSKASDDLPEPDNPVNTTSWSRGISRSTFLRLCSRAPRIEITRVSRRLRLLSNRSSMLPGWPSPDGVEQQPGPSREHHREIGRTQALCQPKPSRASTRRQFMGEMDYRGRKLPEPKLPNSKNPQPD